jgi:hypothetical protein
MIMSAWDAYPEDYRAAEVRQVLKAARAGECAALIGLSGAGKSNLVGFLYHRCHGPHSSGAIAFAFVDGNRAQPQTAAGLFRLARLALGDLTEGPALSISDEMSALEKAVGRRMVETGANLCLLIDRYDALSEAERAAAAGPLRALRDVYKYQLTYVIASRRPLDPSSELAELFYANTIWLGPLSRENALWSAGQFAGRRGETWDAAVLDPIIAVSRGYPSLLRACCEAYAAGCSLDLEALRAHPAVQRRAQEFWADQPSVEDIRRSGLAGHPLLSAAPAPVDAENPDLTASEHRLLAYLQAHPGEVCAKDDLIRAVWPEDRVMDGLRDDSLAQLIRRLRQKIELDASHPQRLLTVPGRGYRFVS